MSKRTSIVKTLKVTDVTTSSVFEIGDAVNIRASSKAFAVQREHELFFTNEGDFEDYPIFTQEISKPIIDEQLNIHRYNDSPYIKVNKINVIGVAASGVFQIGSTKNIENQSRVKHIRQLSDSSDK
ncbi:spore germination protein GerPE [Alteribacillus bidgolensis]|uniref:Spore germination protein PE n=1 Tax=Alteribacillus bidgolensis TaxID=930129 RepID=A0A1G8CWL4_9BACI|nr:spore germination protein GerPE [Alteribacillus bidgolensis]SDH49734.1 spore germination protein PE [Alteribacillus bidgolensis]